ALAAACAAKDEALRALLPCFGALGLRLVRAGEFDAHAESLGRIAARADATLASGADAGPGAALARDETAAAVVAAARVYLRADVAYGAALDAHDRRALDA